MEGEREIVFMSLPFAAGVGVSALVGPRPFIPLLASSSVLALMAAAVLFRRRPRLTVALLAFFAGLFCHASSLLAAAAGSVLPPGTLATGALDRTVALIDSIGFAHPHTGPVITALLTGRRTGLAPETVSAFRQSGASHILALSGLHLGVIYAIMSKVLALLGNSRAASVVRSLIIILTSAFYLVMTGCGPSLVRAFIFIALNEVIRLSAGRRRDPVAILCAALTIQLSFDPQVISSVGFQLSYLAMAGIALVFPALDGFYPPAPSFDPMRRIWSAAALSISCQLFTAPVAWYHFHTFPEYFLISNIVALPLSTLIITSAVTTVCLTALGICPHFIVALTDSLVNALEFCLKTVSTM